MNTSQKNVTQKVKSEKRQRQEEEIMEIFDRLSEANQLLVLEKATALNNGANIKDII